MTPLTTKNNMDLWFSEDDEENSGFGYYWQNRAGKVSQGFMTEEEAVEANNLGSVDFSDN